MAKPETHRKTWNKQQKALRRRLMEEKNFSAARPVFLSQHAAVHTAALNPGGWSCQDEVLDRLSEAQLRFVPPKALHSAVWLLWHITRIEDATMNVLLVDAPQLLHSPGWLDQLGTAYQGVGNEFSDAEISEISQTVDIPALLAYRLAVGKQTVEVLETIEPEQLWAPPEPRRLKRLWEEDTVNEGSAWLLDYWGGNPAANLLLMPATRHPFLHLNEIQRMRPKLRKLPAG